ncbi:MAG: hypothetical protein LBF04_03220 [Prevotellaceae bacterium]|jgi:hypothetical protein|nr:hypothetical protein [Prevotellaceae bacterium]
MKSKLLFIIFFFLCPLSAAYTQNIILRVTSEDEKIWGAHVAINSNVVTITDVNGIAKITANIKDKIQITYMGYHDETFTVKDRYIANENIINIELKPVFFNIDEAKIIVKKDDKDILKQKLKKRLKLRNSKDSIPFTITDTITVPDTIDVGYSLLINGKAIFRLRRRQPSITSVSVNLLEKFNADVSSSAPQDSIELHVSKITMHEIGNSMWIADAICRLNKNLKIFYRGKENNCDIFYFSLAKNTNYKYNGLLYVNTNGIIERIKSNYISYTTNFSTYHLNTKFKYFETDNTILPEYYLRTTYYVNNKLEIKQKKYSKLVFKYSK